MMGLGKFNSLCQFGWMPQRDLGFDLGACEEGMNIQREVKRERTWPEFSSILAIFSTVCTGPSARSTGPKPATALRSTLPFLCLFAALNLLGLFIAIVNNRLGSLWLALRL